LSWVTAITGEVAGLTIPAQLFGWPSASATSSATDLWQVGVDDEASGGVGDLADQRKVRDRA
jgi:hypothetical protein